MTAPHRLTLRNGLRVLLAPSPSASAVAVTVHYDVGFRSEPQGRSGFAHLFEHLMFQGSARYPKLDHWRYVQGLGGAVNGSTHQDYTDYYQLVPPAGLERVLSMEADRMGDLLVTEETLSNQRAVVKEEIRLNVLNRAYGGFPWIPLPALLYRTFPNAHNGYGAFDDLDSATVADAAHFYRTYYVPSNAVLTVAGAFDTDTVSSLVDRHFGALPPRPAPALPDLSEPVPEGVLRGEHKDPHAPVPALALGYRLPDPSADTEAYVARMVLCDLLAGGTSARLYSRLVQDRRIALRVSAGCGLFNSLDARAPDTLALVITQHETADPATVLAEVDAELEHLAGSLGGDVTSLARRRMAMRVLRRNADLLARARSLGTYELLHRRATLVDELPDLIAAVPDAALRDAADALRQAPRAELHLIPGNTQPSEKADQ